jgi:DNA-binding MarR family transcriptional regulator
MPTSESDDGLKLSSQLCFAVYSAAHAFNAAYKPLLEPLGLTYPQYLVLLVLWEQDGIMVKEIGRQLNLDSGTLTGVLKRLEAVGYVSRKRSASDERQLRVELTARGREIRPDVQEARRTIVCALGGSEERVQELKHAVDELNRLLRAAA